ncbi:hypothetical protein [uncultured Endozoicomonas sp.]|uniref:hypothetical protein n=1 Tax=uncultured Endozoicomonas sp. TaxID=432652 RepID=UPI002628C568|nr:hypothetical protein [uncultured Endozoicomonas sp.]
MSKIGANLAVTSSSIDNLKNENIGKTADKRKVTLHKATRYLASIIKSLPKLLSSYKISSIAVKTPKLQPPTTQGSRIADNTAMQQQTTLQALNIRKMTAEPATLDALPTNNTPSIPSKDVNTSIETIHHNQNSITVNTTRDTAELYHSESPTTIGSADLESHTIPMDKIINITLNEPSKPIHWEPRL